MLHAHCYRLLGSVHDADDALQETLLAAWRGLGGYAGRGSFRSWLHRIATTTSIRVGQRRRRRMLAPDLRPASSSPSDVGEAVAEPVFVEPYPDAELADVSGFAEPEARYDQLESVELAFVAALQALPASQRAVLVLRDVLAMPAAEVADTLDTTVAAVNSALQRARATLDSRPDRVSQRATRLALGEEGERRLVQSFVQAWQDHDIDDLVGLLAADVRLTMPPLPGWFDGRDAVGRFFEEKAFDADWRFVPVTASGQLAVAGYVRRPSGEFTFQNLDVLTLRGREVVAIDAFHDPTVHAAFGLPPAVPA